MKLKCLPEDFQVEEKLAARPKSGRFALYCLEKTALGTPEAIRAIMTKWRVERGEIAFAGLKDRHAKTLQYVTIAGGPPRGFSQESFTFTYLGQTAEPVHASDIVANGFSVVLRDLSAEEVQRFSQRLTAVARDGVPNYFDDQRFGSLGQSNEFMARPWCLGNFERAVWLAVADGNVHDSPQVREEKKFVRGKWGKWAECQRRVQQSQLQGVIGFLEGNPKDFRRAITYIRQDLRSLYLAAYQSDIWNRLLSQTLQREVAAEQLVWQKIGGREVALFEGLTTAQRDKLAGTGKPVAQPLLLPLPSARLHLEENDPLFMQLQEILAEDQLELRQLRVKYPRDSFFSKGDRPAIVFPEELSHAVESDEMHAGKQKLTLRFDLRRGSYATSRNIVG